MIYSLTKRCFSTTAENFTDKWLKNGEISRELERKALFFMFTEHPKPVTPLSTGNLVSAKEKGTTLKQLHIGYYKTVLHNTPAKPSWGLEKAVLKTAVFH